VHARIRRRLIVRWRLLAGCLCTLSSAACVLPEVFASHQPEEAVAPISEEARESHVDALAPAAAPMQEQAVGTMQTNTPDAGTTSNGQSGTAAAGKAASSSSELAPLGAACPASGPNQCVSGKCTDGVCCQVGSCDDCQSCGTSGVCEPVRNAMVGRCSGGLRCDAQGKCVGSTGVTCGADNECEDGSCLDQVCCSVASCGKCSACNVIGSEGGCASVRGNDDTDSCHDSQTCDSAGVCDEVAIDHLERTASWSRFGDAEFARVAQSFSLQRAGSLIEVHVELNCEDVRTVLTAELRAMTKDVTSVPSGLVIGSLRDGGVGQSGLRMFVSESAMALNAGESVALVLGTSGGVCAFNSAASYPGGMAFAERRGETGWVSSAVFAFKVLVR
jgi:hypothetical protein